MRAHIHPKKKHIQTYVVINLWDCDLVVNLLKIQSLYHAHFWNTTH